MVDWSIYPETILEPEKRKNDTRAVFFHNLFRFDQFDNLDNQRPT